MCHVTASAGITWFFGDCKTILQGSCLWHPYFVINPCLAKEMNIKCYFFTFIWHGVTSSHMAQPYGLAIHSLSHWATWPMKGRHQWQAHKAMLYDCLSLNAK